MMNKKDELKSVSYKEAKNLRGGRNAYLTSRFSRGI